jgi:peroxidase
MIFFFVLPFSLAQLRFGYYSFTCPIANEIVSEAVQNYYQSDITIVGALIRLHFHDCISNVRSCFLFFIFTFLFFKTIIYIYK